MSFQLFLIKDSTSSTLGGCLKHDSGMRVNVNKTNTASSFFISLLFYSCILSSGLSISSVITQFYISSHENLTRRLVRFVPVPARYSYVVPRVQPVFLIAPLCFSELPNKHHYSDGDKCLDKNKHCYCFDQYHCIYVVYDMFYTCRINNDYLRIIYRENIQYTHVTSDSVGHITNGPAYVFQIIQVYAVIYRARNYSNIQNTTFWINRYYDLAANKIYIKVFMIPLHGKTLTTSERISIYKLPLRSINAYFFIFFSGTIMTNGHQSLLTYIKTLDPSFLRLLFQYLQVCI